MPKATITSKGQITVPAEVRRELGLTVGSQLDFVRGDDGTYRVVLATRSVRDLKGALRGGGLTLTVEEMADVVASAALAGDP